MNDSLPKSSRVNSVLRRLLPTPALYRMMALAVTMAAYSCLALWKKRGEYNGIPDIPVGLEAALSIVIGILLACAACPQLDRQSDLRIAGSLETETPPIRGKFWVLEREARIWGNVA